MGKTETVITSRLALVAWGIAGCVCLQLDQAIQPIITSLGDVPIVRTAAFFWNEIGATWGIVMFLVAGLALSSHDRGATAIRFAVCVSLAGAIVQIMKHLVGRVRPASLDGMTYFYGPLAWFRVDSDMRIDSMPSGHTAAAFAMATALSFRWPSLSRLWYAAATGVGVCRTLTNSHFLSDVVLGALLGTVVSIVAYRQCDSWCGLLRRGRGPAVR